MPLWLTITSVLILIGCNIEIEKLFARIERKKMLKWCYERGSHCKSYNWIFQVCLGYFRINELHVIIIIYSSDYFSSSIGRISYFAITDKCRPLECVS